MKYVSSPVKIPLSNHWEAVFPLIGKTFENREEARKHFFKKNIWLHRGIQVSITDFDPQQKIQLMWSRTEPSIFIESSLPIVRFFKQETLLDDNGLDALQASLNKLKI